MGKIKMPKALKMFLGFVFIIYFISGLIVRWSAMGSGEHFHGWLYYWNGPYKGKVIELDTGKPIEGAVVAGSWYLETVIGWPIFCAAVETTTDKNGEFILPRAWCISLWPLARMNIPGEQIVFKHGYLGYPPLGYNQEQRRAYMPDWGNPRLFENTRQYNLIKLGRPKTRDERESTLSKVSLIFDFDETYKKLLTLLKLINRERKNLGYDEIGTTGE
jgi:hypothetical protein